MRCSGRAAACRRPFPEPLPFAPPAPVSRTPGAPPPYLDEGTSKSVQTAAIYVMGRHRLSEAVGELIRRIDFQTGERSRGSLPLWEQYPAMEALITIGKPSVKACLDLLATDAGNVRRMLAVKVIRYVERPDVAAFIVQKVHSSERDSQRRSMLADAQARMQQLIAETQ